MSNVGKVADVGFTKVGYGEDAMIFGPIVVVLDLFTVEGVP